LSIQNNGVQINLGLLPTTGFPYKILEGIKDFNVSTELFMNGFSLGTSADGTLNGSFTNGDYKIGYSQGWEHFKGDIAEIILFKNALDSSQRASVENYLRFKYAGQISLGPDISAYGFDSIILNAHSGFSNYLWNTGSADSLITVNQSGVYWVQANDLFDYLTTDTVVVNYPVTRLSYSHDTTVCMGSPLVLTPLISPKNLYSFLWSNGATDTAISVNASGTYWVKITDSLGFYAYSDTIQVIIDSFAQGISLGNDTTFCSGNSIGLSPSLPGQASLFFTWSDGSHDSTLTIINSGVYKLTVTNALGCSVEDSVYVAVSGTAPNTMFFADTVCLGGYTTFTDISTFQPSDSIIKWHWQFNVSDTSNLQNPIYAFGTHGSHNVALTAYTPSGCSQTNNLNIWVHPVPTPSFNAGVACINNPFQFTDLSTVVTGDSITFWQWDFGDSTPLSNQQNPVHFYNTSGNYTATLNVFSVNNCTQSVSHNIPVVNIYPDAATPQIFHPVDNAMLTGTLVAFSWLPSANADRYKVIIASDSLFASILTQVLLDTTVFYYTFSSVNQTFFWKVLAYNICSDSVASQTQRCEIFSPANIPGLNLWLKADTGVSLNGSQVMVWHDQSGQGRDAWQTVPDQQPVFVTDELNGMPVLRFDGINDQINGLTIPEADSSSISIFVVAKGDDQSYVLANIFEINN
ncbi:MAG TPA: PKD domain-containing protein, partial [Paludibacteraceae bacterium]|nr:PKD domain-containing protein [Paludibacteraceae bacterium]